MADKEIKYTVLSSLSIEAALNASSVATSAARKVDRNDNTVWSQTVACIMSSEGVSFVMGQDDETIKENRLTMAALMEAAVLKAKGTMPETGKDRDGKTITLYNEKTKSYKWQSWDETRRIWAYLSDIAKIVSYGLGDTLYPEPMKVAARCDVLSLCKGQKSTLEHIDRLSTELQKYCDVIGSEDEAKEAFARTSGLSVNELAPMTEALHAVSVLGRVSGGLDKTEKEAIVAALMAVISKEF